MEDDALRVNIYKDGLIETPYLKWALRGII